MCLHTLWYMIRDYLGYTVPLIFQTQHATCWEPGSLSCLTSEKQLQMWTCYLPFLEMTPPMIPFFFPRNVKTKLSREIENRRKLLFVQYEIHSDKPGKNYQNNYKICSSLERPGPVYWRTDQHIPHTSGCLKMEAGKFRWFSSLQPLYF